MASIKKINVGGTEYDLGAIKSKVYYGTCDTASSTAAKVVSCPEYPAPTGGEVIFINFTQGQGASSITLNINGKGAKSVWDPSGTINGLDGSATGLFYYIAADDTYTYVSAEHSDNKVKRESADSTYRRVLAMANSDANPGPVYASSDVEVNNQAIRLDDSYYTNVIRAQGLDLSGGSSQPNYVGGSGGNYLVVGADLPDDFNSPDQGNYHRYTDDDIEMWTGGSITGRWSDSLSIDPSYYKVGGHKITLATSAPSSPSAGDIWFDLSSSYGAGQYAVAKSTNGGALTPTTTNPTQVQLDTISASYGNIFTISGGGVKVSQAGKYRVCGSVYAEPGIATTTAISKFSDLAQCSKGCYIRYGSSWDDGTEASAFVAVARSGKFGIGTVPVIITLAANDIVYLGFRSFKANTGTMTSNNTATYLLIEKMPS